MREAKRNVKKMRAVIYLPPLYYKSLRRFAEAQGMTASQMGAKILIGALKEDTTAHAR